ncbi:MAG: protein-L-isoaspartate O-methyltransferase [Segetibacter sp.]|nr:protein-L-isoaspartate O-methyltransferase [Segetibacter sp.]
MYNPFILLLSIISILACSCKTGKPTAALPASAAVAKTKPAQITHHILATDKDLDVLLAEIGNARVVLLGEDSHGTSEYYTWRAAITKRLVQEKGFGIVALEADWTDTYRLNNLLTGIRKDSGDVASFLKQYDRWPQWLWANEEFVQLMQWMNAFNTTANNKISIYGLDVYSFEEALDTLIASLHDKPILPIAQNVKQCLQPYYNDAMAYQRAVQNGAANCGDAVNRLWLSVNNLTGANKTNNKADFVLQQNARVLFNGERYFRGTVQNRMGAWNIRDRHMAETIKGLLDHYGSQSKIIVWAHNTHIGDARFTDMPGRGRSNISEMLRKEYGNENVSIVGFGSYKGSVIAAQKWDTSYQTMEVAPARTGSIEQLLHADGGGNKIILMKEVENNPLLGKWLIQRAIGVVENPRNGLSGTYVTSQIQKRYDAFIYFDETHPLHPLH